MLLNGLGSTEVGQAFTSNAIGARRSGTVGKVLSPYRIRIVDEADNDLPAGTEGRLLVQGPTVSAGCAAAGEWRTRRPGDWLSTGDAATVDVDGFLHIAGRLDDIEIVGGINVHPAEIEELSVDQAQVAEAAVCAGVDALGVSGLVAFVVPNSPGVGVPSTKQLITHLRGKVAPHKIPRAVIFVSELPRTPTGKLRRHVLRQAEASIAPACFR